MLPQYPKIQDKYPVVYLSDTDKDLPSHVANTNNFRYTHFKTIARGGKCLIESCRDSHLSRTVCHKSLHPEFRDNPVEQQRFLREARVTAMLQHPNTVPIYELSRNNKDHYYFTMKLVEGMTLREILDEQQRDQTKQSVDWPLGRMIEIVEQVCHALDYAHTHGVVHRDIKPSNILVGPFGEVLLLDWGLAKVWDMPDEDLKRKPEMKIDQSLTQQGGLEATPLYMSPEQVAESVDIDHRTDIYSLGAVLYEVLTLESMAWGSTMHEMLLHTQFDEPESPIAKSPHRKISGQLDATCMACVKKDPADRIQSTAELLERLKDSS